MGQVESSFQSLDKHQNIRLAGFSSFHAWSSPSKLSSSICVADNLFYGYTFTNIGKKKREKGVSKDEE